MGDFLCPNGTQKAILPTYHLLPAKPFGGICHAKSLPNELFVDMRIGKVKSQRKRWSVRLEGAFTLLERDFSFLWGKHVYLGHHFSPGAIYKRTNARANVQNHLFVCCDKPSGFT